MATKKTGSSSKADKDWLFKPGQSGNPSGRKKIPNDIKQAFRELTPIATQKLREIIESPDTKDADRIRAIEIVYDRHLGKPVQAVDLDARNIPPVIFMGMDDVAD